MHPKRPNPETGFLEVTHKKINSFDSDKKVMVLEAIRQFAGEGKWPGIHKICHGLNVSPSAFYEHLEVDAEFKAAYDDALLALEDHLVENLVRQGDSANGVTANIFLLKNRWGKRWNENYQLNIHQDTGQLKGIIGKSDGFIDAQVVDNPVSNSDEASRPAIAPQNDGPPSEKPYP